MDKKLKLRPGILLQNAHVVPAEEIILEKETVEKMIHLDRVFSASNGMKNYHPPTDSVGDVEFSISYRDTFKWELDFRTRQPGETDQPSKMLITRTDPKLVSPNYVGTMYMGRSKSETIGLDDAMKFNFTMINTTLLQHIYNLKTMNANTGDSWSSDVPFRRLMFVGFDVQSANTINPKSRYGILVSTTGHNFGSFFNAASHHVSKEGIGEGLCRHLLKAVETYQRKHMYKPDRIILFRGGAIGDQELSYCFDIEIGKVAKALKLVYSEQGLVKKKVKLEFIAVTRRNKPTTSGNTDENNTTGASTTGIVVPERFDYTIVPRPKRPSSYTSGGKKRKFSILDD